MANKQTLAYSPCPNDTFIFYAMIHGYVTCEDLSFDVVHADVEQLNQSARRAQYDITKLSFHAVGHLLNNYGILKTGSALGRNCGPLIVAAKGLELSDLSNARIAVPGIWTTANLLLGLYLNKNPDIIPMPFDKIMPAIQNNEVSYGVIIHEGRFTYEKYGLQCLMDLGQWWEEETRLPVPLGCIALRRSLAHLADAIEKCMIASLDFSYEHPEKSSTYIKSHAQETDDDVIQQHIGLYVNKNTRYLSKTGMQAIETLFDRARSIGMMPSFDGDIYL